MYSKSKCYIKLQANRTGYFEYARGVRQGCILSPLSFNSYLNELPKLIKDSTSLHTLSTLLYADDLILLSKSIQNKDCRIVSTTLRHFAIPGSCL